MTSDQRLFYEILKCRRLIADYTLSEDGTKLWIQPVQPLDCIELDFGVMDEGIDEI